MNLLNAHGETHRFIAPPSSWKAKEPIQIDQSSLNRGTYETLDTVPTGRRVGCFHLRRPVATVHPGNAS
jgi:hypothetical protein